MVTVNKSGVDSCKDTWGLTFLCRCTHFINMFVCLSVWGGHMCHSTCVEDLETQDSKSLSQKKKVSPLALTVYLLLNTQDKLEKFVILPINHTGKAADSKLGNGKKMFV